MKRVFLIGLSLILAGCVPTWQQAGGLYRSELSGFTATLPAGWVLENTNRKVTYFRKDGIPVGMILFERILLEEKGESGKTKYNKGMLPHELVEVTVNEIKASSGNSDLKVLEMAPAKISTLEGAKAVFTFRKKNDVVVKCVFYGILSHDKFYKIGIVAPQRYYFNLYADDFEKMVASFKLNES